MKRFIVIFTPTLNEDIKVQCNSLIKEFINYISTTDIDKDVALDSIKFHTMGFLELDKHEEINIAISDVKTKDNPNEILVIDRNKDTCYVYKASGTMKEIKKTMLPPILGNYELVSGDNEFMGTVEDLRFLTNNVMSN